MAKERWKKQLNWTPFQVVQSYRDDEMRLVKNNMQESDLHCEGFSRQRDSNPAPQSKGQKCFH